MKRQQQPKSRWHISPRIRRILLIIACAIAGLFVLVNLILWVIYRERTYPQTQLLGTSIGSTPYSELSQKASELKLLPKNIELTHDGKKVKVSLEEMGIRTEGARTAASAKQQRSWLPVLNVLKAPVLKAPIAVDSKLFDAKAKELAATFYKEPANARLVLEGTTVSITAQKDGYSLDQANLQKLVFDGLDKDHTTIAVSTKRSTPKVSSSDLKDDQQTLQKQLETVITYKYNGKTKQASKEDIAKWFALSGDVYAVSIDAVRVYINQVGTGFGIRVKDINQVVSTTSIAVTSQKNTDITLAAQVASKTYTYCTALKNVDPSYLPGLRAKLQSTFSDSRGWGLGGQLGFSEASAGCNFTVWLSSATDMPSFGEICDSTWSCRVGPNVVLNFDRWTNASPAWNANGGTLEEYRHMVINHETGHWLGFGHSHCPAAGAAAPVMQQQSIGLQGCTFNAWPIASELATLRSRLGL